MHEVYVTSCDKGIQKKSLLVRNQNNDQISIFITTVTNIRDTKFKTMFLQAGLKISSPSTFQFLKTTSCAVFSGVIAAS